MRLSILYNALGIPIKDKQNGLKGLEKPWIFAKVSQNLNDSIAFFFCARFR